MGNFNHIPTDILLDIITRLPAESILDCKLVCKPWRNLVSHHPSFSQMLLTHLNDHSAGKSSFLISAKQQLHYFEYNENQDEQTPVYSSRRIKFIPPFTSRYKIIGSCRGLVCLYGDKDHTYCICNPMTREYVLVPKSKTDCDYHYNDCASGFGCLPSTNEYKVVELCPLKGGSSFTDVAVYTLGSGIGWENVKRLNFRIYVGGDGVYVNGVLHWVELGGMVLTFDLNEETFECLAAPPLPQVLWRDRTLSIGVTSVGISYYSAGYYCHITRSRCFDIWLPVERDPLGWSKKSFLREPQRWSKKCSLPERQPLAFTKNGGVLCFGSISLGIYDVKASTWERLVDISAISQISPHKNTLVSLKELGEEDIEIMESAGI